MLQGSIRNPQQSWSGAIMAHFSQAATAALSAAPLASHRSSHCYDKAPAGISLTNLEEPAAHGFVGNIQSTFGQKLLDITKAEREPSMHPDRHLDDGRWKTVTTIGVLLHASIRSTRLSARKRNKAGPPTRAGRLASCHRTRRDQAPTIFMDRHSELVFMCRGADA